MILDIFILSYNRPKELQRIFDNFRGVTLNGVNLIVKDDCSPQIDLIENLYEKYKNILQINLVLYKNPINLGYDMNLLDCFNIGNSEYIFLLSDDDYIEAYELSRFLEFLKLNKPDGLICSYKDSNVSYRNLPLDCDAGYTANLLYDSILFSGLVFKRNIAEFIVPYFEFLKNCIYSQVFLFAIIRSKNLKIIKYSENLLILGGDGDNFFGKNSSSSNENDLMDRTNSLSCFRYQLRLLKVVDYIDAQLFHGFSDSFKIEYSRRLLGFLFKLRSLHSIKEYLKLRENIFSEKSLALKNLYLYSIFIVLIPQRVSFVIYNFGKKLLKKSG